MIRRWVCLIFFAVLLFSFVTPNSYAEMFKYDDLKFSIECPEGYRPERKVVVSLDMVTVMFMMDNQNGAFKANLGIISKPNSQPPVGAEQFFKMNLKDRLNYPSSSIIKTGKVTLGDHDAYEIIYTEPGQLVKTMKYRQIYTATPERAYIINYIADEKDYDKYFDLQDEIVKSFKTL